MYGKYNSYIWPNIICEHLMYVYYSTYFIGVFFNYRNYKNLQEVWLKTDKWKTLRMVSIRSINCAYNVVSISPTYIKIVSLSHYGYKWEILANPSIVCPIRNMYPILNISIWPSRNVFNLPDQPWILVIFHN